MNLPPLDWAIVISTFCLIIAFSIYAQRLNRSVADFLTANRCAGRYLLTMAMGMSSFGAITIIANFEKFYQAGFGALWWAQMIAPLQLVLALSGWIVYRYRATRAMTMAQFFEMRYSKNFRIFSGVLAFTSGIINYGIFPIVSARFIVYLFGFPTELIVVGYTVPTVAPIMAFMLTLATLITLTGGQISVMISDFLQSQLLLISFVLITIVMIAQFGWFSIVDTLIQASPPGQSMVNPFDQSEIPDFNFWFFIMLGFKIIYSYMAWQGGQGYNAAAKSPHEAKMARVLAEWRINVQLLMMVCIPVVVYAFMQQMGDAASINEISTTLSAIDDPQSAKQMQVPVALSQMLPQGLMGLFCASIIAAAISTDDTYLHSWGSIFIQDVILPLKKRHLSPKAHMHLLRISVVGVALFAFIFGLLFPLKDYILMYMALTGAIYIGGAGSVIIGGLYTSWGTTLGAWGAMITGATLSFIGLILQQVWDRIPWCLQLAPKFPLNGIEVSFIAAIAAIATYVILSLARPAKQLFNLDSIFHNDTTESNERIEATKKLNRFQRMIGINAEFTRGDRIIYYLKFAWVGFFFTIFLIGTSMNLIIGNVPESAWGYWWTIQIFIMLAAAILTIIWFLIGGIKDLRYLFHQLKTMQRDEYDDGAVQAPSGEANSRDNAH